MRENPYEDFLSTRQRYKKTFTVIIDVDCGWCEDETDADSTGKRIMNGLVKQIEKMDDVLYADYIESDDAELDI